MHRLRAALTDNTPTAWQHRIASPSIQSRLRPDKIEGGIDRTVVEGVRDLTTRIRRDFAYVPGSTDISTPVAQVMRIRKGVCQDFAHVMIAGLRGLGLPARYASGYLRTYAPAGTAERRGADASHAWVSVWCGDRIGWIDLDPTNDLVVRDEHIVVAYGRDFSDVTPLRGVILGGGQHRLDVAVTVTPLPPD